MCGFIGQVLNKKIDKNSLLVANSNIECRGPDETCYFGFENELSFKGLDTKLIFNRLSIVELSEAGRQPMFSKKFNTLILFNGEIFNHKELRKHILKSDNTINFVSSNSDTEVLLIGLSLFGEKFIKSLIGQFAFVFFNFNKNEIMMCRDRIGQKPLFYSVDKNGLSFSSNLKSLVQTSDKTSINESEISNYLSLNTIPSPETLFNNIYKLKPGELIKVNVAQKFSIEKIIYWNIDNYLSENTIDIDKFDSLLNDSINLRIDADVPVANYLSGGIDSTTIVKKLSDFGYSDLNTFSVVYDGNKFDESFWINKVVEKYNTNHTNINIPKPSFIDAVNAIDSLDEPYSDPSIVPSYLLARETSKFFKVALSGDGGDELLGGYLRTERILNRNYFLINKFDKLYKYYPPQFGTGAKFMRFNKNINLAYSSYLQDRKFLKLLGIELDKKFEESFMLENYPSKIKILINSDFKFFLPEMMLLKVDRTSMKNSLEIRSPFVDHRLIEYVMSIKLENNHLMNKKNILKNYLRNDFGDDFVSRKKMGFVFDIEKFIYSHKNEISEEIKNLQIINKKLLNILFNTKNRINANRLWSLFILSKKIEDF